jgi:hypothetical protein
MEGGAGSPVTHSLVTYLLARESEVANFSGLLTSVFGSSELWANQSISWTAVKTDFHSLERVAVFYVCVLLFGLKASLTRTGMRVFCRGNLL